ncbi:hypothetical protein [Chitinophaga nivalis]|uniref:Uncharacterized protein n=1 Tax=Chitinophaga nivalis TaxID=2991709 RepID=A0ABT3IIJ8_9BACT|nr:hypothetical protein [Chitinophaga nivalis]MCW3466545.1 hypothetical protein [Chitinophaga nivalis]MCW3483764.1 hypothetical protein [Chitinophaga nivalis]
MSENKFTPEPWYPVDYGLFIAIKDLPFYDAGNDLLNAEEVGQEQAENNAKLCAEAPNLLDALSECVSRIKDAIGDGHVPETAISLLDKLKQ